MRHVFLAVACCCSLAAVAAEPRRAILPRELDVLRRRDVDDNDKARILNSLRAANAAWSDELLPIVREWLRDRDSHSLFAVFAEMAGQLRYVEAVPLLVKNVEFEMPDGWDIHPLSRYRCLRALIEIGTEARVSIVGGLRVSDPVTISDRSIELLAYALLTVHRVPDASAYVRGALNEARNAEVKEKGIRNLERLLAKVAELEESDRLPIP